MPRFVVLEHDHPFLHWDLLLEVPGQELVPTWRLLESPAEATSIPAEKIADHRRLYLDYEGPLSGDRGNVIRFDAGEFEWIERGEVVVVLIEGTKLRGRWEFRNGSWSCAQAR